MAITKQDLFVQGRNLRDNLVAISQKINQNKILDYKEKILEKYKDPTFIFQNEDGTTKSPFEVSQTTFPDYMWLQSNGFDKEAKGLEAAFTSFNAELDKRAQNNAFVSLLSAEEKQKVSKMNMNRANVTDAYLDYKKTIPKPEKRTKPFVKAYGDTLYRFFQDDNNEWQMEEVAHNPDWNVNISNNITPDWQPIVDLQGNYTGDYGNAKNPPPKGKLYKKQETTIHDDYIAEEELKMKLKKAEQDLKDFKKKFKAK